ncbi:MAG: hypothetical protein GEU87_01715 [Alphaproteobacteria bacterium]|nr:hypothetical protein [Alphaproteobacteria bacterium]
MTGRNARPRVLVTRPSADAIPLAGELQRRGFDVLLQPLLRIEPTDGPPLDLSGFQALLFTSANGVRAFARRSEVRTLAAYAVGDATAAAAKAEGFLSVASAGGDVGDLAALVQSRLDPAGGKLLHASGSAVAGDLAGVLGAAGFSVERRQLYDAQQTDKFDPAVRAALSDGGVDAALFFSPRSAAGFVSLVRAAGLTEACQGIAAFCLSAAVAEAASPVSWRSVAVAPEPNQESLLATLERELIETTKPEARSEPAADGGDILQTGDATAVVERFGGIRPMATKLGVPVTTVQGWKARGHIPENRFDTVRSAAAAHGVDLSSAERSAAPQQARAEPASDQESVAEPSLDTVAVPAAASSIGGPGVAWAALILAIAALAAIASYRYWGQFVWHQPQAPAELAARIDKLETAAAQDDGLQQRLQRAEQKIETVSREAARLRAAGGGPAAEAVTAELGALRAAIDALGQRMAQAEQRAGASAGAVTDSLAALRDLREEVAALRRSTAAMEERVKTLETRRPATGERIAALAVAAGQLESVLDGGRPYGDALESLKALAAGDQPIGGAAAALDVWAKTGVPTMADLTRRFEALAPKLRAPAEARAGGGWTDTLRAKALALVNMRPLGTAGESSPVTRAERALARSDLASALAALEGVSGPADAWLADARNRLGADTAIAALRARIVERLAAETQRAGADAASAAASAADRRGGP